MPSKIISRTKQKTTPITTLFLDIGGVLLTNGWDRTSRQLAAKKFDLDFSEMEDRHHLNFDTFEIGKLSLETYLSRVVFYKKRSFTPGQFQKFMFAQSKPYPEMIELIRKLKAKYQLKTIVVSNEGRELNAYRIQQFKLNEFIDSFISSCFVHCKKPDTDMFQFALDIAQVLPKEVVYIENTALFVQIAESLGIQSILHTNYQSTSAKLAALGLH